MFVPVVLAAFALVGLQFTASNAPPDALFEVAPARGHHDEPQARLYSMADGSIALQMSCGGCVLDAEVVEWVGADSPARRPAKIETYLTHDRHDEVRIYPGDLRENRAFAIDIIVTVVDEKGAARSESRTLFGHIEDDGSFLPATWEEIVCVLSLAECIYDDGGRLTEIRLSEDSLEAMP